MSIVSDSSTPAEALSDDALMQRFAANQAHSACAFDVLYARYKDKTWGYFRRQLSEDAARDAQQELWMKLIERRTNYVADNKFGGYLFSIAHSVLVDAQRKHMRVVDRAIDHAADPNELSARPTTEPTRARYLERARDALAKAIGRLPLAQRNAFVLQQESGLSYADIAEVTQTTQETVKSRLRYARSKLTEELEEELRDVDL